MCRFVYSWNPVYNFVIKVKHDYQKKYGKENTFENPTDKTILEYWIDVLGDQEYIDRIKPLIINQYEHMVLLRYGNFATIGKNADLNDFWDLYDGFYKECRSIVIDLEKERIVICPFKKFRNLGECEENTIENIRERINGAKCVEFSNKLDGSMQCATWYNDRLLVAGSQAIDPDNSWRLQDGISMLNANPNYIRMIQSYPMYTFIFEYISVKDAHVVKYTKEQEGMYLIGIRNSETGEQASYARVTAFSKMFDVPCTQLFATTFDNVLEDIKTIKSDEQEGFVLNIDGYMVKIKGDDYVQIHKIISAFSSPNIIIKSLADGNFDDLLAKIPAAYKEKALKIRYLISEYIATTEEKVTDYYDKAPKTSIKDFMIWVDHNVEPQYRGYVRNRYLGIESDYIKSGNEKSPHYKTLKEMGIDEWDE